MANTVKIAKLSEIEPDLLNANRHTERGNIMLRQSMEQFGFAEAGTLDRHNRIIGGNHRTEIAADVLDAEDVIIIETDGKRPVYIKRNDLDLSTEEGRRLSYMLNRSAQVSIDFDPERIWTDIESGVELGDMFREDELKEILGELGTESPQNLGPPDVSKADELQEKWGTAVGQIWVLGPHRLACGDCTDRTVVEAVMGRKRARYGIHDPPYGINVVGVSATIDGGKPFGNQTGSIGFYGVAKTNVYRPVEGDDKSFDPTQLLLHAQDNILWGANYYADKLPPKKGWIVWDKKGREDWRDNFSDCELAWSSLPIVTKIFRHTWMGMVQEGQREKRVHPTQKPVQLFIKIMGEVFKEDGIIIDFYLGSGTTLLAAHQLNRRCYGCEIDPGYVAVILQRFLDLTNIKPELIK